ncbi:glutamyl-tRNA reductase [Lysobacteraceae bacterium NML93-0399]|nr:glutamyl-tRNA reductase [Xanthomonadaceae bacterium NML93-0399]
MSLFALGINHQTAPVALRERVAFGGDTLGAALTQLRGLPGVREVALLSTCNRTEVYAVADDDTALAHWLSTHPGDDAAVAGGSLQAYLYRHRDADAVRHLFRVATGLDSLVLGEPQILGQVKQAWASARAAGVLGGELDRVFQHAFVTAKRARSETRIGNSPVSVASLAVRLAQESFARPADSAVLLVGAGETIELAARHLAQARVKRLLIANRTYAHAQELAARHGGIALPLDELDRHLFLADVVFSATASREPVIGREQVAAALAARKHRPMLLMDLAVPRDIAPEVAQLRDVFLYTVDDLERTLDDNRRGRREAAGDAEAIIDLQVDRFRESNAARGRLAPVKRLRAHGEAVRGEALARARQQLAAGQSPDAVLELLAHTLTNRLLHVPTAALRDAALRGDDTLADSLDALLPPDPAPQTPDTRTPDAADPAP